jgi:uncharacterized protein (TIGR03437 family)
LRLNITNLPTPQVVGGLIFSYDLTKAAGNTATVVQGSTSYTLTNPLAFQLAIDNGLGYSTTAKLTVEGTKTALVDVVATSVLLVSRTEILPNGWPTSGFPPLSNWDYATSFFVGTPQGSDLGTVSSITSCTASAAPSIKPGGVISASAFGQFTSAAPGSWIEIYGSNLATSTRGWRGADFNGVNAPTSLDGTKVTIGGQPAFIDYISPGQVNAQIPSNVGTGPQPVIVSTSAGASLPFTLTIAAEQPGLLAPSAFNIAGKQYVAALFADGTTYVLPPGTIAGLTSRRAQPGDTITLYGVGFGPVTPDIPAGQVVQQTNHLLQTSHVLFGQTEATVTYAGLAPNAVGLYQLNVVAPNITGSDAVPLTVTLAGSTAAQILYIAVQ